MKTKTRLGTDFTLVLVSLISVTIASGEGTPGSVKAPQASSQVRYRLIDLGPDATANEIIDSGRIVGSLQHLITDVQRHVHDPPV